MIKVRNRLYKKTEYKGKSVLAIDKNCPCRSCFVVHNIPTYIGHKKIDCFVCLTNYKSGCPDPMPANILHKFAFIPLEKRKNNMVLRCKCCNQKIKLATDINNMYGFMFLEKCKK